MRRRCPRDWVLGATPLHALILGSASIASAATVTKHAKPHVERGSVMLLENNGASQAAADTRAAESFQDNWNIGYCVCTQRNQASAGSLSSRGFLLGAAVTY